MPHDHPHTSNCCEDHDHEPVEKGLLYSLYLKINLDDVTCLNELVDGSGKTVFKPWEERLSRDKYVQSDADAELLFNVPFNGNVKIKTLMLVGGDNETHPRSMRLFVNRPQMSFDDTSAGHSDKEFELTKDDQGVVEYPLPMTKFSSVNHLSIHIPTNYGSDTTVVYYVGFSGEFLGAQREGVVLATYEARPMPQDHKGEIPDMSKFEVS